MIANDPAWEPSSRLGPAGQVAAGRTAEHDLPDLAEHQSPGIAEAVAARLQRSPWTIIIASVSIGVIAGCLVKRR